MLKTRILSQLFHWKRRLFGARTPAASRPADPRVDQDPWLAPMFDLLGARYRLGDSKPLGTQILRRTGRERFNPMRVYLRTSGHEVCGEYDVRIRDGQSLEVGRALLDREVTARLSTLGLTPTHETVEEWGGQVITRRYEGAAAKPEDAAAVIRFFCEESTQVMDTAIEG